MDPRMMRQWLVGQTKKVQVTEAQIQRKRLGIAEGNNQKLPYGVEDNTPSLLKRPLPQYKAGFSPATDSYVSNEPTWKIQQGEYIKGQGPLSPKELDKEWIVTDRAPAPGYVPPKDDDEDTDNINEAIVPQAQARAQTVRDAVKKKKN